MRALSQHDERWGCAAGSSSRRSLGLTATLALVLVVAFALGTGVASASKEAIDYFGTESGTGSRGSEFRLPVDVAVNSSGAGPASKGDIYAVDLLNERIQRFAQNSNGTPADPYDDKYEFISAWGTDVDSGSSAGGNYEICTVAAECQAGISSGGNGTSAGNGDLSRPGGLTVDQDSGQVYVVDEGNNRVNVYEGDGTFLRSFGWDVVASGPGNTGAGYEVCVAANGDVCQAGAKGSGVGQLAAAQSVAVSAPDSNVETGTVYVSDSGNHRVNTYGVSGNSPSSFVSTAVFGPDQIAVDSRGIVYTVGAHNGEATVDRFDTQGANGGGIGPLPPILAPPLAVSNKTENKQIAGLEVDFDSDGPGPDSDVLYVLRNLGGAPDTVVQQFGPLNPPGLTAAPTADDDEHGGVAGFNFVGGLGFDESNGRLFISDQYNIGGPYSIDGVGFRSGVYVLDTAGGQPTVSLNSLSDITATSVKAHISVSPNGPPDARYWLEYSTDGVNWEAEPKVLVGSQESPQSIEATLSPAPIGLEPNTLYHVRAATAKPFAPKMVSSETTFTSLAAPPEVETTGAPLHTTSTAQLGGRVNPRNKATAYHFEYGSEGSCDANPCTSTESILVGSGDIATLVAAKITGLQPNQRYHYRVVAENGAAGSPAYGADLTVDTSASEAPLSHGHFPGPPDSDRAYEMVSTPDSGGNPVGEALAFSPDGNRAVYQISGGTPSSETGSFISFYYAQRGTNSWQTESIMPPRAELVGSGWFASPSTSSEDLDVVVAQNANDDTGRKTFWRLSPNSKPSRIFDAVPPVQLGSPGTLASQVTLFAPGSERLVVNLNGGTPDPAYPGAAAKENLYDVSSGTPHLVSLLPGNTVSACGLGSEPAASVSLSADGRYAAFATPGNGSCNTGGAGIKVYLRDLDANETSVVTPTPLSGSDCGSRQLLRLDAESLFFWTKNRLTQPDANPTGCGSNNRESGDVYRYDISSGGLDCLTCVLPGYSADVLTGEHSATENITVSADHSRIYFRSGSARPLVRGAVPGGQSTYVLEPETGKLHWMGQGISFPQTRNFVSSDGATVTFTSQAPALNPLGGTTDNGGTQQLYRYDDDDRSLVCLSCPQDGSAPNTSLTGTPLRSADAQVVAFETTTALLGADQNTPPAGQDPRRGIDVYEWREGRLFLITDGLTDWPHLGEPRLVSVSPTGRDIYFSAAAQLTPDALDGYQRLYDARIGGGFEFPPPPKPCPLEVCQGTPKGAPEEPVPGSTVFSGPSNAHQAHNPKRKKHHRKRRPKKAKRHHRAHTERRNVR